MKQIIINKVKQLAGNNEEWKDVPGYEGVYCVSNFGGFKSIPRKVNRPNCRIKTGFTKRGQVPQINQSGYYVVNLYKDGIKKMFSLHRLVALVFIPNPNNYKVVNHKDGNRTNNRIENLEWCSQKHNMRHAWDTGLCKPRKGDKCPVSKLTEKDVRVIKMKLETRTGPSLAKEFGVHKDTIYDIKKGKTWRHVI